MSNRTIADKPSYRAALQVANAEFTPELQARAIAEGRRLHAIAVRQAFGAFFAGIGGALRRAFDADLAAPATLRIWGGQGRC